MCRKTDYFRWKSRTKTEIGVSLLAVCCCAVVIYLMVAIYIADTLNEESDAGNVCLTPECVISAASLLDKLSDGVDPCDDFYEFVCGKFARDVEIPEEESAVSASSLISDKVHRQLRDVVAGSVAEDDPAYLKLLKAQYRSCMNTTKIEDEALVFVKRYFKRLGGWPLLEPTWNERRFDWKQLLYRLRRSGWRPVAFFVQMRVEPDVKNSSRRILTITQPRMPSFDFLKNGINDTRAKAYYEYLVKLATLCGASELSASAEIREVLNFESELARINSTINAPEHDPMTIKRLQETVPSIPWLQLINNYLSPIEMLTSKDEIDVAFLDYFQHLESLLLRTQKRTIANYMFSRLIEDSVPHLPEKFRYEQMMFEKAVSGKSKLTPRWVLCVAEMDKLNVAASAVYVKNFFNASYKAKIGEIGEDVRSAFMDTIDDGTWMDPETKKAALLKVEEMNLLLAYPDELLDDKRVEEFYRGLELDSKDYYLKMAFNLSVFSHMKNIKTLRAVVRRDDWMSTARTYIVDAFYRRKSNSVEVAAALLQGNFFSPNRPQYMNYGSIGEAIAREMVRAFDRNPDSRARWSNGSLHTFARETNCSAEQFSGFTPPGADVTASGGDSLGGGGGLDIAYRGYLRWLERNEEEPLLSGVDYTPRQTFWISSAVGKCAKSRRKTLQAIAGIGPAPPKLRTLAPLVNSEYFADDFDCALGSPMNPEEKCQSW